MFDQINLRCTHWQCKATYQLLNRCHLLHKNYDHLKILTHLITLYFHNAYMYKMLGSFWLHYQQYRMFIQSLLWWMWIIYLHPLSDRMNIGLNWMLLWNVRSKANILADRNGSGSMHQSVVCIPIKMFFGAKYHKIPFIYWNPCLQSTDNQNTNKTLAMLRFIMILLSMALLPLCITYKLSATINYMFAMVQVLKVFIFIWEISYNYQLHAQI